MVSPQETEADLTRYLMSLPRLRTKNPILRDALHLPFWFKFVIEVLRGSTFLLVGMGPDTHSSQPSGTKCGCLKRLESVYEPRQFCRPL